MTKSMEVVYMAMPVSKEEKQKLNAEGKRIVDIRFAPEGYEAPKKRGPKPKAVANDSDNGTD